MAVGATEWREWVTAMGRTVRASLAAVALVTTMAGAGLAPAYAGGPVVFAAPDPVAPDGVLSVTGSGCGGSMPITVEIWDVTGGGGVRITEHHTANSDSTWDLDIPLDDTFEPGRQIGVVVYCGDVVDDTAPHAYDYVFVAAEQPTTRLRIADDPVGYHQPLTAVLRVTPGSVMGGIAVYVDGEELGGTIGDWDGRTRLVVPSHDFPLDQPLALGAHRLRVVFDPVVEGPTNVVRRTGFTVVRSTSRVTLGLPDRVRSDRRAVAELDVRVPGWPKPGGVLTVWEGDTLLARTRLVGDDAGTTTLRLPRLSRGEHRLRATYSGGRFVRPDSSPRVVLTVVRPR